MSDADAVWAQTTDGGLLHQLFGYYPTLHDARIREVRIQAGNVTMVVDYRDAAEDGGSLAARMQLEWRGVRRLELPLGSDDLYHVDFGWDEALIVTRLQPNPGDDGIIVAEAFEVTLMQLDPGPAEGSAMVRYWTEPD